MDMISKFVDKNDKSFPRDIWIICEVEKIWFKHQLDRKEKFDMEKLVPYLKGSAFDDFSDQQIGTVLEIVQAAEDKLIL